MTTPAFSPFAAAIYRQKYAHTKADGSLESWDEIAARVARTVLGAAPAADPALVPELTALIAARRFLPGGRYLYAAGRSFHQVQNCLLLRADDSREGWGDLTRKATLSLMSGAGIGVDYSALRGKGALIARTGGVSSGPLALMQIVNEIGRRIVQGGSRRSAIWAGLSWRHPDALAFIGAKDWDDEVRRLKAADFAFPAALDGTNISVTLDREFFAAHAAGDAHARAVYSAAVRSMLATGEPGFSVDVDDPRESLRNACTEVTSADDSDICNLGSLNLAQFDDLPAFTRAVEAATAFLLAGTLYSDLPYPEVGEVRTKNRRLGLGLMGLHEWLLKRGKRYEQDAELGSWLAVYQAVSTATAARLADRWGLSRPVKTRAIAPTGTIGIVAETTTGIEPIFCVAYRRRYLGGDGETMRHQYVVDPTAARLIAAGVAPEAIEDAYTLAADCERRVSFQAWVQGFVDHAISSTVNLPPWGSAHNDERTLPLLSAMFLRYLPRLRGLTCYPDGARGGQPLERVGYATAKAQEGQVFEETRDRCEINGRSGDCGS